MSIHRLRNEPPWDRSRFQVTPLRSAFEVRDVRRLGSPTKPAPRFSVFTSDEDAIGRAIEKYLGEVEQLPESVKQQDRERYEIWLRSAGRHARVRGRSPGKVRRRKLVVRLEMELVSLDETVAAHEAIEEVRDELHRVLMDRLSLRGALVNVRAMVAR